MLLRDRNKPTLSCWVEKQLRKWLKYLTEQYQTHLMTINVIQQNQSLSLYTVINIFICSEH